jgi:hypothetical protein
MAQKVFLVVARSGRRIWRKENQFPVMEQVHREVLPPAFVLLSPLSLPQKTRHLCEIDVMIEIKEALPLALVLLFTAFQHLLLHLLSQKLSWKDLRPRPASLPD